MHNYGGLFSYIDWTFILIIISFIITLVTQIRMKSSVRKYSSVISASGLTGAAAARMILDRAGLSNVALARTAGELTDHYDPRSNTVTLSQTSCDRNSIAAIGVAAHECGHAMQDAEGYLPLKIRNSVVPAASIGSRLAWPIFFIGLIFSIPTLLHIGIILFTVIVIFHLVTLPVEFDASSRALKMLEGGGIITDREEIKGVKKVLTAAAMTYVAALLSSVMTLLRLILISGGSRRD